MSCATIEPLCPMLNVTPVWQALLLSIFILEFPFTENFWELPHTGQVQIPKSPSNIQGIPLTLHFVEDCILEDLTVPPCSEPECAGTLIVIELTFIKGFANMITYNSKVVFLDLKNICSELISISESPLFILIVPPDCNPDEPRREAFAVLFCLDTGHSNFIDCPDLSIISKNSASSWSEFPA